MSAPFTVGALDISADRAGFCSGSGPLDRYFHELVAQDVKRRVTACFVATASRGQSAAYYTLASASVLLSDLPSNLARKMPRYPSVPAVRMGRLAVANQFRGQGLGAGMLADALRHALAAEIAAYAMIVDAKDAEAAAFYEHHGFMALPERAMTLFLPLAAVRALLRPRNRAATPRD